MSQSEAINRAKMNSMWWYHKIDLGGGIVTPGLNFDRVWEHISHFLDGIDFTNKTVLDIGCWDGKWTFDAERRGARLVVASDDLTQRARGGEEQFKFAHSATGSKAIYYPKMSVYNIDELPERPFDIVLFLGVLYHLRYPLFAIAKIRQVLREGGILVVETACIDDSTRSFMEFQLGLRSAIYEDPTTWCAPSVLCLQEMLESSYFDVKRSSTLLSRSRSQPSRLKRILRWPQGRAPEPLVARGIMEARAAVRGDVKHAFPDPFLGQYDSRFRV